MGKLRWATGTLAALALLACDPLANLFEDVEPAQMYTAAEPTAAEPPGDRLRVMTWNIKFGGARLDFWFDCHGDYHNMPADTVRPHLDALAAKINELDPDLIFLQEADVDADRSANIDQVQYLLDRTAMNYGAYASQWRSQYIPSEQLGRMDSGNAILSRWPLADAIRIALPLRTDQDELTRQFYLKRNMLEARVDLGAQRSLKLIAIHAAAYSQDGTKLKHVRALEERMAAADDAGELLLAGGDLNTQPPGSAKWSDYPDSVCEDADFQGDDHSEEQDWLIGLYRRYFEVVPLEVYVEDNAPHFTHSTSGEVFWNRTLDYLFANRPLEQGRVVQEGTMPLSDHAPKIAELVL